MRIWSTLLVAAPVAAGLLAAPAAHAEWRGHQQWHGGGGGGWHGGGGGSWHGGGGGSWHGGGWHGDHWHGGGWWAGVYLSPWWGWWPYWYGYPYAYYPYYSYPAYAYPAYTYSEPSTYVEQQPAAPATTYWYYCTDPSGYYPYVARCNKAWMRVLPQSPQGSSTAPPPSSGGSAPTQ